MIKNINSGDHIIIVKNGLVFDYKNKINGEKLDLLIKEGIIVKIARNIEMSGRKVIDAESFYIIPGLVDMHSHLREPGQTNKETIESGTLSAAKGGIATVVAMPNTEPAIDNPDIIRKLKEIIDVKAVIEVLIASSMTKGRKGIDPVDFIKNTAAGCACFSDDGSAIQNYKTITEVCRLAKESSALLIEHPETDFLAKDNQGIPFRVSYGKIEQKFGIKGQPAESESLDILRLGNIAGMIGEKVHFTHISTEKSAEAIRYLKKTYPGLFTCDCTPHHLTLSESDIISFSDTDKKINPPLRPESDRRAIESVVIEGLIDAIATDHAPHTEEEKGLGFDKAPFGTVGFETFLPVTFSELVKKGKITMIDWINLVSYKPSQILGIARGVIEEGKYADLTIFNPDEPVTITKSSFISKGKNSAFTGRTFHGAVKYTLSRGKIVYNAED